MINQWRLNRDDEQLDERGSTEVLLGVIANFLNDSIHTCHINAIVVGCT